MPWLLQIRQFVWAGSISSPHIFIQVQMDSSHFLVTHDLLQLMNFPKNHQIISSIDPHWSRLPYCPSWNQQGTQKFTNLERNRSIKTGNLPMTCCYFFNLRSSSDFTADMVCWVLPSCKASIQWNNEKRHPLLNSEQIHQSSGQAMSLDHISMTSMTWWRSWNLCWILLI